MGIATISILHVREMMVSKWQLPCDFKFPRPFDQKTLDQFESEHFTRAPVRPRTTTTTKSTTVQTTTTTNTSAVANAATRRLLVETNHKLGEIMLQVDSKAAARRLQGLDEELDSVAGRELVDSVHQVDLSEHRMQQLVSGASTGTWAPD